MHNPLIPILVAVIIMIVVVVACPVLIVQAVLNYRLKLASLSQDKPAETNSEVTTQLLMLRRDVAELKTRIAEYELALDKLLGKDFDVFDDGEEFDETP